MTAERMSVENNSIYITFNQFLQSHIEEMRLRPVIDSKGSDLTQACEVLLNSSLLSYFQDITESNFQPLNNLLEMIMTWVKFVNMPYLVLERDIKLMDILYTIPNIRKGLIVKVLQWMIGGVNHLLEYETKIKDSFGI